MMCSCYKMACDECYNRCIKPVVDERDKYKAADEYLAARLQTQEQQLATLTHERDALRECLAILRPMAMYYAEAGGSNCIEFQDYLKALSLLTPSGEAGKGGGV